MGARAARARAPRRRAAADDAGLLPRSVRGRAAREVTRRADIQGLRAVAVALVVAYHASPHGVPGGYVGVDVFFVISGFLITRRLVDQIERDGRVSFGSFYARRIRRVLPAATVVLLATLLLARWKLPPLELSQVAADARAAALYFPNVRFADQAVDYLARVSPSPLLHYWSLGVEEQFYLLWPLLLLAARRALLPALAVVGVASLAASVLLSSTVSPWAFYGLHTRAWEFAVGGLVALGTAAARPVPRVAAAAAAWLGLAAIAAAALLFSDATPYPGAAAALPVGGAALVIAGGAPRAGGAARLLGLWPLQRLGDVSYSLYLWHWPLLILLVPGGGGSPARRAGLVALSLALAVITYRLVERPALDRRGLARPLWRPYAVACGLTLAALGGAAAAGTLSHLDAGRPVHVAPGVDPALAPAPAFVPSNLRPPLARSRDDVSKVFDCVALFSATRSPRCVAGSAAARRAIVLFGDSHAAQWAPAFGPIAAAHRWRLVVLSKASCPAALVRTWRTPSERYPECDAWRSWALRRIARIHPLAVVMSDSRSYVPPGVSTRVARPRLAAGMLRTMRQVRRRAAVLLIADTPQFAFDPPTCLSQNLRATARCGTPAASGLDRAFIDEERRAARAAGAAFADFGAVLCPGGTCQPIHGDLLVYSDANHLGRTFVAALRPRVEAALHRALPARVRSSP